jgi:tRNA (adenine22-N1)-methyltransferase
VLSRLPIELSARLARVAALVPVQARLVDVGTDHALLPIHLVQTGRVRYAIASDIRSGPTAAARQNVARYGIGNRIEVRQGPGLSTIRPGEVDTIVIAGMGGQLAAEILSASPTVVSKARTVIVQPMSGAACVRQYLLEHEWRITHESVVSDDGYHYMVVQAIPGLGTDPAYAAFRDTAAAMACALEFGPYLLTTPTQSWLAYVDDRVRRWQRARSGMAQSEREDAVVRRRELDERLRWLAEWMQRLNIMARDVQDGGVSHDEQY